VLPGGGVEVGEDLETALARELHEEIAATAYHHGLLHVLERGASSATCASAPTCPPFPTSVPAWPPGPESSRAAPAIPSITYRPGHGRTRQQGIRRGYGVRNDVRLWQPAWPKSR